MVAIPGTNFDIFPLNLGGNPFGWTADKEASFAILDAFVEAGGNFIDTADVYSNWGEGNSGGESEEVIGEWLKARPDVNVIVATKSGMLKNFGGRSREKTYKAVEASLKRLGVDSIDLFYYHLDDEEVSIEEQVKIAEDLISEGKIKHLALSNYSPERFKEFLDVTKDSPARPVAIQPQYSLLYRGEFEGDLQKLADDNNVAVFTYFSLASGLLTGKYRKPEDIKGSAREGFTQGYLKDETFEVVDEVVRIADSHNVEPTTVALAWLRANGVTAPIASVSKVAQLPALMAVADLDLSQDEIDLLDKVSSPFK